MVRFDAEIDTAVSICGDNPTTVEAADYSQNEFRDMAFNPNAAVAVGNTRTLLQELFGHIGRFSAPSVR